MKSALRSRDRSVKYLQRLNDLHTMGPDGACSCGTRKDCASAKLLYERWPQQQIQRLDDREQEEADEEAEAEEARQAMTMQRNPR